MKSDVVVKRNGFATGLRGQAGSEFRIKNVARGFALGVKLAVVGWCLMGQNASHSLDLVVHVQQSAGFIIIIVLVARVLHVLVQDVGIGIGSVM